MSEHTDMIDWGDELKPRTHSGRLGMDAILKDARRGELATVKAHLRRDPSLLTSKSGGHNRTFLWEAARGNRLALVNYLLKAGADANVPGRIRAEIVVLLKPYCIARRHRHGEVAESLREITIIDIYSACFLGEQQLVKGFLDKNPSMLTLEQPEDTVWRVTPLHFAVAGGHPLLVQKLIELGAPVKPYTRLLLNAAVRMRHPDLIPILLDGGADRTLAKTWAKA
jgi:ankyrin repeat protein